MSNEELAKFIQDGQKQYIETLWLKTERFIHLQADKYLKGYPEHISVSYRDDLHQSGYLALLDAIRTYQAGDDNKSFVGWLSYHLKTHFNNTLGQRTVRDKKALHHHAISLEMPLQDVDDMTLADTIIDPDGEKPYSEILDAEETKDINQFIVRAIKAMPEDMGEFYLFYFRCGLDQKRMQESFDMTRNQVNAYHRKGIVYLRRWMDRHEKERQEIGIDDLISLGLRSGLRSYRHHCFTSSTEIAAMRELEIWEADQILMNT